MKRFLTLDDMLPIRQLAPQQLRQPKHETRDAVLGKAVCALVFMATPKFKFNGIPAMLKSLV